MEPGKFEAMVAQSPLKIVRRSSNRRLAISIPTAERLGTSARQGRAEPPNDALTLVEAKICQDVIEAKLPRSVALDACGDVVYSRGPPRDGFDIRSLVCIVSA
jgi:hypothetical protein